jgi:signal peptidase II
MKKVSVKYFVIAFFLVIFDQITKLAVKGFDFLGFSRKGLEYGEVIPVIRDFLQWTYIENQGMAFGISFGWGKIFLSLFSLIASGLLIFYINKISEKIPFLVGLALALILAGAFGNARDRCFYGVIFGTAPLFYGAVVDFILVNIPDISVFGHKYNYFPVFNIADSCVTCGVILLIFVHHKLPDFNETFPALAKNFPEKKEKLTKNIDN